MTSGVAGIGDERKHFGEAILIQIVIGVFSVKAKYKSPTSPDIGSLYMRFRLLYYLNFVGFPLSLSFYNTNINYIIHNS